MILPLLAWLAAPQDTPRQVVEAMFAAFNRHDAAAIARLYAPDARLASSDFCSPRGGKDVERTYRALFAALPDIIDEVEIIVAEGEHVAVRFTAASAATDLRMPIQAMLRVRNGKIVEDDSVFDTAGQPCQP
jgi:ketosteroid isomerase-like protein